MGVIQYFIVLLFTYNNLDFSRIFYVLITISIYLPAQKLFKNISDIKFSKIINIIALLYGVIILVTNFF